MVENKQIRIGGKLIVAAKLNYVVRTERLYRHNELVGM